MVAYFYDNFHCPWKPSEPHLPTNPRPSLLTDKSGPLRQHSIFEWNIPGNTHIGSADLGSSTLSGHMGSVPASTAGQALLQSVERAHNQCIIPDEDPNRVISLDGDDEEGHPFDLMGDGVGDEDDGGEDESDQQELHNGPGTAVGHKTQRTLPPAIKDEYERHLDYLKQTPHGSKPCLYEINQTFWLPHQANFFILNRSSKPYPAQLYNHRWFYWDPDHLVEGGLKCPNCGAKLHRHGFSRPRCVVDLQNVFYMIGQRHRCPKCRHPKTNEHSITFNSWDHRIVAKLPKALAAEFPACLSHRNAIADSVMAVMRTCFQYGMGSKQFSNCLQVLHHQYFDTIHAQYLDGILERKHQP